MDGCNAPGRDLHFLDLDGEGCSNFVAQLALDGVGAHILDGIGNDDLTLIQLDAGVCLQGGSDGIVGDSAEEFAGMLWENLNEEPKASLFVRYIDLATGETDDILLNQPN